MPSCPPEQERHAFTGHQEGEPLDVERFMLLGAAVAKVEATKQRERAPASPRTFEYTDRNTGEVVEIDLVIWAAQNPSFDIVAAVGAQYRRGSIKDGKQHIACPFEGQHTDQGEDKSTFVANASPPQYNAWEIHCCHAHCEGRDRLEYFLAMLEKGWISAYRLQTAVVAPMELRRPLFVNYPVIEISSAPEWSTLRADERRIALDLMVMAWTEDDGMIGDDDWMIARRLDITEEDWKLYRETLRRTGWLMESNKRLSSAIVKREFDKAHKAYNESILNGRRGGKASAAARQKSTPP